MTRTFFHSFLVFLVAFGVAEASPFSIAEVPNAGVDGPYVFYRKNKVVVKNITIEDGKPTAIINEFPKKTNLTLSCTVSSTGDVFSFPIHNANDIPPHTYPSNKKVATLSDIEGNFKGMKMFLLKAGVIDANLDWKYGDGHLVLVGDFFDRGLQVTECLWLLYKLDAEALAAGGRVHFILGNHEIMNMQGDVQSVRKKYIANAALLRESYKALYAANTELGRWLRSKNTMEKIGNVLFVHGGLSPKLVENGVSIQQLNDEARERLNLPGEFTPRGPASGFALENREHPVWFRGMAKNMLDGSQIDAILTHFDVQHVILGHTVMKDITLLHGGKIIIIDQFHAENTRKGFMKSLIIANGKMYSFSTRDGVKPLPIAHSGN